MARTRRTTPVVTDDVEVPDEIEILDEDLAVDDDPIVDDVDVEDDDVEVERPARKYFSHANCDHARKGEAGKAARAQCRRAIRNYLAAEAEFLATEESVAV